MENITVDLLKNECGDNVEVAHSYLISFYPKLPILIKKPFLKGYATSAEARDYANKLEIFEVEYLAYKELMVTRNAVVSKLEAVFIDYIKELSGLNKIVPEQYRDKVYSKAYESGHSDGYNEIYNHLLNLIEIFE